MWGIFPILCVFSSATAFVLSPQLTQFNRATSVAKNRSLSLGNDPNLAADPAENVRIDDERRGAISMTVSELGDAIGGWGRARLAWDCYAIGVEPQVFFHSDVGREIEDFEIPRQSTPLSDFLERVEHSTDRGEWREEIRELLPTSRNTQGLGRDALAQLAGLYAGGQVDGGVATVSHIGRSMDGTTKLLLRLADGLEVESVIIPWEDKGWSTLCISSQVGCRQGCTFCATGRMGKLRSLSSDEILAQMYFARKICRIAQIPEVTNVVFMGMGEPSDNADAVTTATKILTDVDLFQLAQSRVTVSTVAPTPDCFRKFASAPCVLAWSVHAASDKLRRKLVPTTTYSMVELRQGLIDALLERPKNLRATMVEVALMAGVNDSVEAAEEMADFVRGIVDGVPGIKLVVNLIPFNDIGHPTYRKPSEEAVLAFQSRLWARNIFTHIRTTRGDDEAAACGQLATKKKNSDRML